MSLRKRLPLPFLFALAGVCGCTRTSTTADGTRIVPFTAAQATPAYHNDRATYQFELAAWTDRMPTVTPRRAGAIGFPVYVALHVSGLALGTVPDSLQVAALSLWNAAGDSLLGAFSLVRTDGSAPWVYAANPAGQSELTHDRTRPRYRAAAPDELVVPYLLVIDDGREKTLRLPSLRLTAAY